MESQVHLAYNFNPVGTIDPGENRLPSIPFEGGVRTSLIRSTLDVRIANKMKTILLLLIVTIVPQEPALAPGIAKWEEAIGKLEQRNQTEVAVDGGVVYYGSSSIRRWDTVSEDMAPWPAIQRGYGGAKLPDILHYAPRVIGPHLGKSNCRRSKAIVLFVANDISGKKTDASPEEAADRFSKLLSWIRQQDATIPVFWIEVTPSNSRWKVWPKIEEATKRIRETIDSDANAHLISTAGAFLGLDGRPRRELFVKDQLHLSVDGYKQWAVLIKAQLHSKLGASKPQSVAPDASKKQKLDSNP